MKRVRPLHSMGRYVLAHWRGEQSLALSFWVNLVGFRLVIFSLQSLLAPAEGRDYSHWTLAVTALTVLFHGALLLWQIVGVVRSADNHFAERGNMALVWGAQLGAVLMFLLSAVYALEATQMTRVVPVEEDFLARMDREHASLYRLNVTESGKRLTIDGQIELGITQAVKRLLETHPSVESVTLSSPGGNIYEGRGLARLFGDQRLDTRNESVCASACTIAYVGGQHRTASPEASFGFHQYRVDADYTIIVTDVAKEQQRDSVLFTQAGVSAVFADSMFHRVAEDMWWPALQELVTAGVVHEVRQ